MARADVKLPEEFLLRLSRLGDKTDEICGKVLEAGAEVVTAHNGQAAVEAFTAAGPETFDCILMDLMMPVMSGFEAARMIRGLDRPDAGTVPIIALSANAFEEDIALAKDAGMNEHLAKPVDMDRMFQVMGRLRSPLFIHPISSQVRR